MLTVVCEMRFTPPDLRLICNLNGFLGWGAAFTQVKKKDSAIRLVSLSGGSLCAKHRLGAIHIFVASEFASLCQVVGNKVPLGVHIWINPVRELKLPFHKFNCNVVGCGTYPHGDAVNHTIRFPYSQMMASLDDGLRVRKRI